jgi:hypothetical protein
MSTLVVASSALPEPARTLKELVHNCDKDAPLASGDPRWQDLSPGRGDRSAEMLVRDLLDRPADKFVHAAFVSHRGAGKSTELRRVTAKVAEHYHTVFIEATVEMDPLRIESEDLLLNIALEVEEEMRSIGKPLPSDLLGRIQKWFADIVRTTKWAEGYDAAIAAGAEGKLEIPFLGSMFAQAKALMKHESEYRTEVKQVLKKFPGSLLQSVNDLLDAATAQLGGRALLVVVDNLDRYEPPVIDELLVVGADRIRSLHCNLVLTPPMSLLLQPRSAQLEERYDCYDMFAVRLRGPKQRYDEFDGPGRELMERALAKRIDLDLMIPSKEVRDRLIAVSGGGIRELFDLVAMAARFGRGEVIEEQDVEAAIARRKQRLRDQINVNDWSDALSSIADTKQLGPDKKCLDVLFHRLAFKYNGVGWYDVHPLVHEILEESRR